MIIRRHTELDVYNRAFAAAMRIFELTKGFPKEERFSLVDQIRRSSRSVCGNIAEAWRRVPAAACPPLSSPSCKGGQAAHGTCVSQTTV